ncbi:hypothetical protein [Rickettsia endosymbiont of Gonocerus acuteangulatus]|uniref:hypothetical protein n=1 Tax=Rickettsia endosymbiont of Gonocerus acuteangulatus TaxID=3066266 RepID=UPI003132C047
MFYLVLAFSNNIGEFPEYFNDLFNKENKGDAAAQSKLENINIGEILTPKSESHAPPHTKKFLLIYLIISVISSMKN